MSLSAGNGQVPSQCWYRCTVPTTWQVLPSDMFVRIQQSWVRGLRTVNRCVLLYMQSADCVCKECKLLIGGKRGKGKGKVHPRTGHEGPEGE